MSILHLAESADFFCGSCNIGKVESLGTGNHGGTCAITLRFGTQPRLTEYRTRISISYLYLFKTNSCIVMCEAYSVIQIIH